MFLMSEVPRYYHVGPMAALRGGADSHGRGTPVTLGQLSRAQTIRTEDATGSRFTIMPGNRPPAYRISQNVFIN